MSAIAERHTAAADNARFHIDESFAPGSGTHDKDGFVPPSTTTQEGLGVANPCGVSLTSFGTHVT